MLSDSISWIKNLKFDENGLLPVIAQDYKTNSILMLAWMNDNALYETVRTKKAVYWSRSRNRLWRKGEESGHVQIVHDISTDCDKDAILIKVEQTGGISCHTGRRSCFFFSLEYSKSEDDINELTWEETCPILKDPKYIYK
ncbi:phosphoribosyl-AMP cyclohydrolase [Candidatus Kinetoplastibacterium oncopeltii TCC290E]|uniref:Phosphoribosyl-AMP cyclohydrolase n=1 Tax=Candidatus Kinetoplastidibacterium stringomonadis TCC290E TaxID=1208920 RepID=M1LXY7_9PROT|nr:phosphoribosyl-AMP cyclohydrolase [Candidatus Kinetoplastibacterium oncopeltii]AGF48049.1 phosphoribosyl-AMP cyclohydrolase [Candidatus Kinetoplastibacterium oncopeltii TCC290E]